MLWKFHVLLCELQGNRSSFQKQPLIFANLPFEMLGLKSLSWAWEHLQLSLALARKERGSSVQTRPALSLRLDTGGKKTFQHLSDTLARGMGAVRAEITPFPSSPTFHLVPALPCWLVGGTEGSLGSRVVFSLKSSPFPLDVEINKIPTVAATSPL